MFSSAKLPTFEKCCNLMVIDRVLIQREYKEAVAKGHGAYLMDESEDKPEVCVCVFLCGVCFCLSLASQTNAMYQVFTVSVGNLPAGCDVFIKVRGS